jgi:hypothetical protein
MPKSKIYGDAIKADPTAQTDAYAPTAFLRFVTRKPPGPTRILQQWWAENAPDYMRSHAGEWRDVPMVEEDG